MVCDLECRSVVGVERWEREKLQKVIVNFTLFADVSKTGNTDNLSFSHNYGACSSIVSQYIEQSHFKTVEALAYGVSQVLIAGCGVVKACVRVEKPTAILYGRCAGVEMTRTCYDFPLGFLQCINEKYTLGKSNPVFEFPTETATSTTHEDKIFVSDLLIRCIIGVNSWERLQKQSVILDLTSTMDLGVAGTADSILHSCNYRDISTETVAFVEESQFLTLEAFVTAVAKLCVQRCHVNEITVKARKPTALLFAEASAVEITRKAEDFSL
ncbi:hypothetical protein SARC_12576 [Sphaeroforma arctica JP610]|uniref:dihydroneopterin aldolase n=1 Tax=Sphaeroforma arctica JP610 TaxID=667725 RepID=A0A0L0FEH7_9EUKA|nr:hypothetical protein SARC_12576 [Sphaeroforma arctica JP610]KNC74886.1 hypothetical protein SARC_12576 [Sphaeroforma arctica JP610]|eukprot:XP_014148788.1 hypothetical protein SARC_12576 [Sphaeroforma arctica JP610]